MRLPARIVMLLAGAVVAFAATAVPLHASEGHCGDAAVATEVVPLPAVAPPHGHPPIVLDAGAPHVPCPACPDRGCGVLHGCAAAAPSAASAVPGGPVLPAAAARLGLPPRAEPPRSFVVTPPTPPPLTPLASPA